MDDNEIINLEATNSYNEEIIKDLKKKILTSLMVDPVLFELENKFKPYEISRNLHRNFSMDMIKIER